jgi:hypothetical protein
MMTTVQTAAVGDTILAVDPGKYKSVASFPAHEHREKQLRRRAQELGLRAEAAVAATRSTHLLPTETSS